MTEGFGKTFVLTIAASGAALLTHQGILPAALSGILSVVAATFLAVASGVTLVGARRR